MKVSVSRRGFIRKTSLASAGVMLGGSAISSAGYARIIGANDRMNFAVAGLHGRGNAHLQSIAVCNNTMVSHICDVDNRYLESFSISAEKHFGQKPVQEKDYRKLLESKDIDVVTIATPEHWHAPMAIMGLQAGKHVYLEKPCSHNPREGEMLVEAQKKYKPLIQMGNQQRSSAHTIKVINMIREGVIGKVYYGKAWYSSKRTGIGVGKVAAVPDYLDWELWQGPAPRKPYKDNVHPYNWHWFWHWGTGETLNNGTHEVDVCRWALDAGMPLKVTASGGRYHYSDDWEFYDTLQTSFEYEDKMITWEGISCQGKQYYNRGRGVTIHGTEGTILIDRSGYILFNRDEEIVEEYSTKDKNTSMDVVGGDSMTDEHFKNLINGIKTGEKLHAPIDDANISVSMLQLSNIAWKTGRSLALNPANGHIRDDAEAMKMWGREYEKGWEPKV